jgi:hypothetical protein
LREFSFRSISSRGLVAYAMQGFDYKKARVDLEVPDNFDVMTMIAIGKKESKENLNCNCKKKNIK